MNEEKQAGSTFEAEDPAAPHGESGNVQGTSSVKEAVRLLAVCYLGYLVYELAQGIITGDVSKGEMPWMIAAIVLFCIGMIWLAWPMVKRIKEVLDTDELR